MSLVQALSPVPPPLQTLENGAIRIAGTRVSLDSVIWAFKQGQSAEEIVEDFPTLKLKDVYAVITYYLWHQSAVEAYLEEHRQKSDELRREIEARQPPTPTREELLARRAVRSDRCD